MDIFSMQSVGNDELKINIPQSYLEEMIRKEIRQHKDPKLMPPEHLKMLSCYKKDGIELSYKLNKDGGLIVELKDTTYPHIREKFLNEKKFY